MHEPSEIPSVVPECGRRGSAIGAAIAWMVILACTGYALWQTNRPVPAQPAAASAPAEDLAGDALDPALENAARLILALQTWFPSQPSWLLSQAALLQTEGPKERMVYAIMAADLASLADARAELVEVEAAAGAHSWSARSTTDRRLVEILQRLYAPEGDASSGGAGPSLISNDDRTLLSQELRWFGRFAPLARDVAGDSAERDAMLSQSRLAPLVIVAFCCWLLVCGGIGLITLVVLLVRWLQGRSCRGFGGVSGRGGVYAEAFAVFLTIFTLVHVVRDLFGEKLESLPPNVLTLLSILMQVAAFAGAVAWAVARTGSWRTVRADVGLHAGRGVVREAFAGFFAYCAALPMLVVGMTLMFILLALQKIISPDAELPSHPAQEMLRSAGWGATIQIFVLGVIVAPIIEETAFRGMLYRHLRDGTSAIGVVGSVAAAAAASSLIFAAIHPQSWPAIPALASLAVAFCIAREWRGSLIPSIVAHGISNFVMLTVGMTLFRG